MNETGILVILSGVAEAASCLRITSLASRILGHPPITVLHVRAVPASTIMPSEEVLGASDIRAINHREAEEDAGLADLVARWDEAGARWLSVAGYEVEEIRNALPNTRLVVLPHPSVAPPGHRQALETVLFAARIPIVMVPAGMSVPVPSFCRHLAIGWRDSPITRHALDIFSPFIIAAEKLTVIEVVAGGHPPAQSARAALGRYRTDAVFTRIDPAGAGTGRALLAAARQGQADTLLIGAHRHAVLQEWILGTVTKTVLNQAPFPILAVTH